MGRGRADPESEVAPWSLHLGIPALGPDPLLVGAPACLGLPNAEDPLGWALPVLGPLGFEPLGLPPVCLAPLGRAPFGASFFRGAAPEVFRGFEGLEPAINVF